VSPNRYGRALEEKLSGPEGWPKPRGANGKCSRWAWRPASQRRRRKTGVGTDPRA
jgi:hypothetical protein